MSVGGLAKIKQPNARKASSLRKMASSNTATATRSTTYSSTARSGSVFNSYGVLAQRTLVGTRAHTNPKVFNSYTGSLSSLRHALNDNRPGMPSIETPHHCEKTDNSSNVFAAVMMGLSALGQAVSPIISDVVASKTSSTDDMNGGGADGGVATKLSDTITNMRNAKDVCTLGEALNTAKEYNSSIDSKLESANTELTSLKGQTEGLETKSKEAKKALDNHNGAISKKKTEIKGLDNTVKSWESALSSAQAKLGKLSDDDPGLADAQAAVDNAQTQLKKAQAEFEKAQGELKELEGKTPELKQNYDVAKETYEQNVKDVSAKEQEVAQLKRDKSELPKELEKQEKRLTKLREKEGKDIKDAENTMKNILNKYGTDYEPGISNYNVKLNDKDNEKFKTALNKRQSLVENRLKRGQVQHGDPSKPETCHMFSAIGYDYMIDGKIVSCADYEKTYANALAAEQPPDNDPYKA